MSTETEETRTPEKFLCDWIDENGVTLEGATPAMLVAALRGHMASLIPTFDEELGESSADNEAGLEMTGDHPAECNDWDPATLCADCLAYAADDGAGR